MNRTGAVAMRGAVMVAGLLVVAACGQQRSAAPAESHRPAPSTGRSFTVATGLDTGNVHSAAMSGVLYGRTNPDGTACFWFDPGAKGEGPVAVLWPYGSRAYARPLRVVSSAGQVLGRVGHHALVGGGFIEQRSLPLKGCPTFKHAFGG
jgi:hypothetical protein